MKDHIVRRAKKLVLEGLEEGLDKGYQLLEPFLNGIKALNPGSVTAVERDGQSRFRRLFVMLGQHVQVSKF